MQRPVPVIGLVGDYDASVPAHQAIPLALRNAGLALKVDVVSKWVPTDDITDESSVADLDGLWCIPASPYRNTEGALLAIEHARRNGIPFLGTCGGFQHAVVEYARHVLGWTDAEHAETAPNAQRAVISALECALVEVEDAVHLVQGTRIAAAYGTDRITEGYRCRYGLNAQFREALLSGPLRASAQDATGEVRAIELDAHPFFVATLFQPERAALRGAPAPLVTAFVQACGQHATR